MRLIIKHIRDLIREEIIKRNSLVWTWIMNLRSIVSEMDDYDFDVELNGISARRLLMQVIKMLDRDQGNPDYPDGGDNVIRLDDFR